MSASPSPPSAVHRARATQVGPYGVRLRTDSLDTAARWTNLLAGLPDAEPDAPPLEISIIREGPSLTAEVDGDLVYSGADEFALEIAVTRRLNERKLDAEPELVHLHSAAVSSSGSAVLLIGRSGQGKSTLTARLVEGGWRYLTDEQVTLRPDDRMLIPYARPITLRRAVWREFSGVKGSPDGDESRRVEVPLSDLAGTAQREVVRPALIIAPQYDPGATNTLVPIESRAEVVRLLASCCYDLERTGPLGMDVLVDLADRCPAYRLGFSDLDAATVAVAGALPSTPKGSAAGYRMLPGATGQRRRGLLQRREGVTVWQFGDSTGLAFDHERLRYINLDPMGVAVWDLLGSAASAAELLAEVPDAAAQHAVERWIENLLGLGFVERFDGPHGRLSG